MPIVVNTSKRLISFPVKSQVHAIHFTPGIMQDVAKADWDDINKRKWAKKLIDEGVLVTGKEAKKISEETVTEINKQEADEDQAKQDADAVKDEDD